MTKTLIDIGFIASEIIFAVAIVRGLRGLIADRRRRKEGR